MDGGLRIYNVEPLSEKARIGESIYNVVILITSMLLFPRVKSCVMVVIYLICERLV